LLKCKENYTQELSADMVRLQIRTPPGTGQ